MTAKTFWAEASILQKVLSGIAATIVAAVTIGGSLYAAYNHFTTDLEAAELHKVISDATTNVEMEFHQYQKTQVIIANKQEINDLTKEINAVQAKKRRLAPDDPEQMYLQEDIDDYQSAKEEAESINDCIRDGKEFCFD